MIQSLKKHVSLQTLFFLSRALQKVDCDCEKNHCFSVLWVQFEKSFEKKRINASKIFQCQQMKFDQMHATSGNKYDLFLLFLHSQPFDIEYIVHFNY